MRCRVLEGPENAVQVDVQYSLERRLVRLPHRPIGRNPSVGDDDVDATGGLGAIVDRRAQSTTVAYIDLPPRCSGAQVIGKATQPVGLEPDHGQACTSGGCKSRHSLAYAACGSGNYQSSAGQVLLHHITITSLSLKRNRFRNAGLGGVAPQPAIDTERFDASCVR